MSLRNITTLIEIAAILNQTLANQVEQSQQLSQELRANATEQIGTILKVLFSFHFISFHFKLLIC
jgi:hypothetical protein